MKRFGNVSLIYECDQPTLQRAALLAKENHARLTIIHAIKEFPNSWQHLYVDSEDAPSYRSIQPESRRGDGPVK